MNLSSYLQMPPAPLVPAHTHNATAQGASAGVSSSAGNNLGFDFAEVMARQIQRLAPHQRQTLAADAPQPSAPAVDSPHERRVQTQHQERPERDASDTRTSNETSDQDENAQSTSPARARHKTQKTERSEVDALLDGLMQGAPIAPLPAVSETAATSLTTAPADFIASNTATLQTVELSPQMRIITDPKASPSPESLAAFAKSMGLDEATIQDLLAQQPAAPKTTFVNMAAGATGPQSTLDTLPHAMQMALNSQTFTPPAHPLVTPDSVATAQLAAAAENIAQPATVSGAGLAAPASTLTAAVVATLPSMTPTDLAAIQQLQITVLPAAVLPSNSSATHAPSTMEMLSLLGAGLDEQDVDALLSHFSSDTGSDSQPDNTPPQGEGNHFSSFAQALNGSNKTNNVVQANAAPTTATPMSEVYDQLSDKMATELAARMHKQLSDGEWKMKFGLRPSNLGGVEIQLEMKDGKLDAIFRADNSLTRDLLQNSSQRLREALGNFGIHAGQVNVGQGGGNAQHNSSGNPNKNSQVRDNSPSHVSNTGSVTGAVSTRNKANASLLDLYA